MQGDQYKHKPLFYQENGISNLSDYEKMKCKEEFQAINNHHIHQSKKRRLNSQISSSLTTNQVSSYLSNNEIYNDTKTKESYCEFCMKSFCNKYSLKKHKQSFHGISYSADGNSSNLNYDNKHVSNWHCNLCCSSFYSAKYLESHMKKTHYKIEEPNKKNLKKNILFKLKSKLLESLKEKGFNQRFPKFVSFCSLIRLKILKSSKEFKVSYKSKDLNKAFIENIAYNTKKYPLSNILERSAYEIKTFQVTVESKNLPKSIIERIKIPKKINVKVKSIMNEQICFRILLKAKNK